MRQQLLLELLYLPRHQIFRTLASHSFLRLAIKGFE
jgi:hypothetical protein